MQAENHAKAISAINEELNNMLKIHDSLQPILYRDIPEEHKKNIMILIMFLKEKYSPSGEYIKMKARLVVGGNTQNPETYSSIASPTVNPITLMTIVNLAVIDDRKIATFDVPAAFLVPPMDPNEHFYGVLDEVTSSIAVSKNHVDQSFRGNNNKIYFRIRKYQYGLHQASMKFYEFLVQIYCH